MAKILKKPAPAQKPKPAPAAKQTVKPADVKKIDEVVKPKSTAVAHRPAAGVPAERMAHIPDFMREDINAGKEGISQEDLEIPRLKLIQGVSPELTEYDGLRAGMFFHPSAEHVFDEPFIAVPVFKDKRYILWNPLEAGGGILARADDGVNWSPGHGEFNVKLDKAQGGHQVKWRLAPTVAESGLANWGTMHPADPNSPPAATLMYNYLLAFPEHPDLMPAVLSFQRSSIKSGKRFQTKLLAQQLYPIFATKWEFSAKHEQQSGRDYYTIAVRGAGLLTADDRELYEQYKAWHAMYSGKGLNIKDVEGLQREDDDAATADGGGDGPNY